MEVPAAKKIIREFVRNDLNGNVVGAGFVEPTMGDLRKFKLAVQLIGIEAYREISKEETQRFKKAHNL